MNKYYTNYKREDLYRKRDFKIALSLWSRDGASWELFIEQLFDAV